MGELRLPVESPKHTNQLLAFSRTGRSITPWCLFFAVSLRFRKISVFQRHCTYSLAIATSHMWRAHQCYINQRWRCRSLASERMVKNGPWVWWIRWMQKCKFEGVPFFPCFLFSEFSYWNIWNMKKHIPFGSLSDKICGITFTCRYWLEIELTGCLSVGNIYVLIWNITNSVQKLRGLDLRKESLHGQCLPARCMEGVLGCHLMDLWLVSTSRNSSYKPALIYNRIPGSDFRNSIFNSLVVGSLLVPWWSWK